MCHSAGTSSFVFLNKVSHWNVDLILQSGWTHWLWSFRGLPVSFSPGLGVQAMASNARLFRWALGIRLKSLCLHNGHFHARVTPPSHPHLGTWLLPEFSDGYSWFYKSCKLSRLTLSILDPFPFFQTLNYLPDRSENSLTLILVPQE